MTEGTQMEPYLTSDDPVLTSLRQAEEQYRRTVREYQTDWSCHQSDLSEAQSNLAATQGQLTEAQVQATQAAVDAERHRERANKLAAVLKDIHRSLFSGNVYELILRACLTLTGATRGLYVIMQTEADAPHIRAAVDVDGYPQAAPSEFIRAICTKVFQDADTLVSNSASDVSDLPSSKLGEQFHNFLAAPVVLLKNLSGIVIAADKQEGDFNPDDEQLLLSIGD